MTITYWYLQAWRMEIVLHLFAPNTTAKTTSQNLQVKIIMNDWNFTSDHSKLFDVFISSLNIIPEPFNLSSLWMILDCFFRNSKAHSILKYISLLLETYEMELIRSIVKWLVHFSIKHQLSYATLAN